MQNAHYNHVTRTHMKALLLYNEPSSRTAVLKHTATCLFDTVSEVCSSQWRSLHVNILLSLNTILLETGLFRSLNKTIFFLFFSLMLSKDTLQVEFREQVWMAYNFKVKELWGILPVARTSSRDFISSVYSSDTKSWKAQI